ncbi:MAG: hypothetical protein Q4B82_04000 [Alysiella sp.]|uniref:hypothetical protein n=1 Tax=Alysiella sp. TaxID=1872483 RepID=UPI0026DAF094|nr:hypothetical protein [Alysiella sp.]MDO4433723.1 hypothetical protein [Alysiella sp.]
MLKVLFNYFGYGSFFYFVLVYLGLIERKLITLAFFILFFIIYGIYKHFFKMQNNQNKPDADLNSSPVYPPISPNPPDLNSAQFNEFIKSREKEKMKVYRE